MSTRATYHFEPEDKRYDSNSTVYIHYDGYVEGAAYYFYNLLSNPSKGDMATQFIRANESAELTKNHDVHGDTAYRYDIKGHGPEAIVQVRRAVYGESATSFDDKQWEYLGEYSLVEFVNKYCHQSDDVHPFKQIEVRGRVQWHNLDTARRRLSGHREKKLFSSTSVLEHLRIWSKTEFNRTGANWHGMIAEAKELIAAFPELFEEFKGDEVCWLSVPNEA